MTLSLSLSSFQAFHQAIAERFDRRLKILDVLSLPVRVGGDRFRPASEADIENVVLRVAFISGQMFIWVTHLCEGDGGFSYVGAAVCVAPDTVPLLNR